MLADTFLPIGASLAVLDEAQWQRLFECLGTPSLLVFAQSRLGPQLLSEIAPDDVVQEALLSVWRARAALRWQGVRALRGWVMHVIEHRIRDAAERAGAAKRGGHRCAIPLNQPALTGAADRTPPPWLAASTTPSRNAGWQEEAERIRRALAALPEEFAAIVRLRVIEQKSLEVIAVQSGLTLAAVRHRLRRGAEVYARLLRTAAPQSALAPSIEVKIPPDSAAASSRCSAPEA